MARKANPKIDWVRKSNCLPGPGQHPGNKYNFTSYLKKTGDFVETHPMTMPELYKIRFAVHIWAYRHHCRIKTEVKYRPTGVALMIEVISNTRKERK